MPAFVIGIGGGSASGKSKIAQELCGRLRPLRAKLINQDAYFHPPDLLPRHRGSDGAHVWPDHNHPDSFDVSRLRSDLLAARTSGDDVVIVEGILVLHYAELRGLMDLRLFVNASADERIVRRIRRNVARGYDLDEICAFYLDSVRYRHAEYCEPTRAYADIVVPGGCDDWQQTQVALAEVCRRVHATRSEVA
jgi:uridine kinase